jgi:16S rRNA (guanine527-N7)-methyltransferase
MREQLCKGLEKLNIAFNVGQIDLCLAYIQLLLKWNKAFNLTAVTQPKKMVPYLLLDSLSLLPYLEGKKEVMDVGTGAGLPGVPLAIFMPDTNWVLCDSNGKKTRFIRQACAELGLKNITVVNQRVEDYHHEQPLDVILSKAYASLSDFVQSTQHLCSDQTILMTLKSGLSKLERRDTDLNKKHLDEVFLSVPGINEPRSIVTIKSANH